VDAFGREPSYEEILFGKRNGWNALEEETTSRKDKKYNHRAAVNEKRSCRRVKCRNC
jgi:hypothetical protein